MLGPEGHIGRYEIRKRVAYGGMGTLYLAHDPVLDRTVALKLFHADLERPEARDRFVREARAVAALNNPNIVTIYDYGEYSSQPFLVMEYIEGETLAALIHRRPVLPIVVELRWMEDLCAAISYAHDRGIIHRDIKPANLMVDAYGRIKVLDFGIARMRGTLVTHATGVIGTPGYAAPEQIRGGPIDHRSDLFSAGVVCYELFSYVEPFGAESTHAITHRILTEDPVPLDTLRPSIDPDLARIVDRALQKDPDRRFASAEAFRDALAGVRRRLEAAESETAVSYVPPAVVAEILADRKTGPERPTDAAAIRPAADAPAKPVPGFEVKADVDARKTPIAGGVVKHEGAAQDKTRDTAAVTHEGLPQVKPHRRTTRESLARQREDQIRGWVQLARDHFAAGELAEAREACAQAIALEPANVEAMALLASIDPPFESTPRNPPAAAETPSTAAAPVQPAPSAAATSGAPPGASAGASPVVAPPFARPPAAPRVATKPGAARGLGERARRLATKQRLVMLAAAAAVVVAAIATWIARRPGNEPPVLVVIDASPWATVAGVARANGDREPLPADASTPLALQLAPGAYRVQLVGPPPALERREKEIRIESGSPAERIFEPFRSMTADEYFRQFGPADFVESAAGETGGKP